MCAKKKKRKRIQSIICKKKRFTFDIANQAELDTHIADDIATAHPNGTFPVARLDVDVATQTELDDHINDTTAHSASAIELSPTVDGYDEVQSFAANVSAFSATVSADLAAHEAASTNVHGIGVESSVVGTKTDQNLEKKTILSDFVGSKVLIWPEDVTDEEKEFFDSSTPSADQIKIRDKSIAVITATDNTGFTILTVDDSSPFTGGQSVEGFQSPGFTISLGSLNVLSVPDANTVELDGYLPALVANDIIVNTSLSALFCVSETGLLTTTGLHVQSHPFNDIELDDNVTITGTLTVTGASDLQDNVAVTGTLAATSNLTAGANITADASITGLNLFATNDLNVSVDATIGGQLLGANAVLSDDLNVFGNFVLDGYASVGSDLSVSGGFDVSNFFSAGNGASVGGGLTVGLDANIGGDLQVFGSTHINDTFTVDGYSVFNDDLFVNGNIIFSELTVSSFTDASRPDPTTISKGVIIFNDDDLTLNVSDGTNWRDMTGSIT